MKSAPLLVLLICSAAPCLCAEAGAAARASPPVSAAISAGLPRFEAVPIEAPQIKERFEGIALPPFIVKESQLLNLSERELLTKAGMEALLRERYPGASFRGQDPEHSHVPNYAALMYRDDLRLRRMAEFEQLLDSLAKAADPAETKQLKGELQKTFLRGHDWQIEGMDKSVNHWRR